MNRRIDVRSILPSVRVPALVLHSRADALVPVAEGRKLAAAIPGAKYIEYGDLPHGACFAGACEGLIGDIEEFVTGHRDGAVAETDRVLATVLFTDIVGSTRMAVEVGDQRWHELLDRHDRLAPGRKPEVPLHGLSYGVSAAIEPVPAGPACTSDAEIATAKVSRIERCDSASFSA